MTKKHRNNKRNKKRPRRMRFTIPARGVAEIELGRVVAEQIGLSWGHGLRLSETSLESGLVAVKIRIAGKGKGIAPAIVYATFTKIKGREWAPVGPVNVVSMGVVYSAVCIESEEGTLMSPLVECGACE